MSEYANVLKNEDPRIPQMFSVAAETEHSGSMMIEDPFPALSRLRGEAAVHKGSLADLIGCPGSLNHWEAADRPSYSNFTFESVSQTLIDNETFSSEAYNVFGLRSHMGDAMLNNVGAKHRHFRDPIQPFFTPQAAASWWSEKIISETVETLISTIEKKGEADLFLELCARMPVHVVSAGFGIPPEEIIPFRLALMGRPGEESVEQILTRLIEARRKNPENDLLSKLLVTETTAEDGSKRPLNNEEIIANSRVAILAGGGTTWRQLGITLFALLNNPDQFEDVKADRSLISKVVLESARWHATDIVFPRLVTRDVNLSGVDLPEGAILHMCLGAANRDPSRWENPDQFDIHRPVQRSVAFGAGPHSCLGQHVSRQEMVLAINAIIDRLPNVRWDKSKPPAKMIGGLFARGPSAIPVVFG